MHKKYYIKKTNVIRERERDREGGRGGFLKQILIKEIAKFCA